MGSENYSEKKFKSLLDFASDGIHILDKDGNVLECSYSFAENLGYTLEEVKKLSVYDWEAAIPKDEIPEVIKKLIETPMTFETKHRKKDGTIIDVQINAKKIVLDDEELLYASQRDITKQKEDERKLIETTREQNSLLSLFDISDSVLFKWKTNQSWDVEYVSKNVEKLFGYTKEEFLEQNLEYASFIHYKDIQRVVEEVSCAINTDKDYFIHEPYRIVSKDGKIRWVYDQTVIQRDLDGEILNFIGYITNITKQINYEQQIINQKNQLESIFNTALEGIAILDMDTRYIYFNNKYLNLLGYSSDELKKKSCLELTSQKSKEKTQEILKEAFKNGSYENYERECVVKDGQIRIMKSSITLMPNKKNYLITTIDVTDMRKKEQELEEQRKMVMIQSKMASISELLKNLTHNWKQPLNEISASMILLGQRFEMNQDITKQNIDDIVDRVENSIDKLSSSIDNLKLYMSGDYLRGICDFDDVISDLLSLENLNLSEKDIDIVKTIEENIKIYTSKDALLQILLNIFNNSIEALKNIDGKKKIYIDAYIKKQNLVIKVKDNGGGIVEENLTKIFDPYFTTHHQSFGKGMGLNIVYNVVTKNLNGEIYVKNIDIKDDLEIYHGVEFKIVLPLSQRV